MQHSLSWSHTRMTLLEWCERKYFLNYYDFALKHIDPDLWKQNAMVKRLKSVEMWIGEKTHYLLSDYLHLLRQFYREWDANPALFQEQLQTLKDRLRLEMEHEFLLSQQFDYSDVDRFFQQKLGLTEHYYHEDCEDLLSQAFEKVFGNLDRFLQSSRSTAIRGYFEDGYRVYIETPREVNFDAMKVDTSSLPGLEKVSLLAVPDFGVVFSPEHFLIVDRKSGKEDILQMGISDQLKVYALKRLLKSGKTSGEGFQIELKEVYLQTLHEYGGVLASGDIEVLLEKIKADIQLQASFLKNGDIVRNEPLGIEYFHPAHSKKCETCTFRAICQKLSALSLS